MQLFDRSGLLYGELARFVLRILGIRTKPKMRPPQGPDGLLGSGRAPKTGITLRYRRPLLVVPGKKFGRNDTSE